MRELALHMAEKAALSWGPGVRFSERSQCPFLAHCSSFREMCDEAMASGLESTSIGAIFGLILPPVRSVRAPSWDGL